MPKKWENNWGRLSKDLRDNRNKKLSTLGNLAIITQSLNASIRDANWKIKKKGRGDKEGLFHFSAGIETLSPYLELEEWNEDEIEKRAKFLFRKAAEMWNI
jgi:NAD+--asparagine ADP-ribosyltransferase